MTVGTLPFCHHDFIGYVIIKFASISQTLFVYGDLQKWDLRRSCSALRAPYFPLP